MATTTVPANPIELVQPDESAYWVEMVKCRHACPVHTDACGYVNAIAEGRYEDAYRIIRATNPFASICGRVCGAPCELNCRRGALDEPVSIRALKRFVTGQFGPETGDFRRHREFANEKMLPPNRGDYERVAVVGGGVSGMTVAHDLTRIGYKVTVFEADAEPGGMTRVGVPVYRLPRDLVMAEINAILSLGVELKCNMRLGRDFTIPSLRAEGFAAIFLGIGLPKGRKLNVPGNDLEGVWDGMEFLRSFNEGTPMPLGERIVVVGGGNVAYDVARSALRPAWMKSRGEEIEEINREQQMAYDVARSALRMSGDKEVHVVCLESRDEMPADEIEIEEGKEEGVRLHARRGPLSIEGKDGKVKSFRAVKCVSVFDENKKFSPKFDDADVEEIPADTVIFAIGQTSDLSFLDPADGVASERGLIKVNPETYQTTAPDVFACGDIAHGPRLFIDAVASAQIAARSMHDFLRRTRTDVVLRRNWKAADYTMADGWDQFQRENPPALDAARRASSVDIVEENFSEADARHQASRCLRCNINTVFDTSKCVGCNGCVDVCPERLIRLTPLTELIGNPEWAEMLDGADPAEFGAVLMKDESTCLRCAMCASRCPTHAITMQQFEFAWECVSIPAPNAKINYGTAV